MATFEILFSAYCALFVLSIMKEDNSIADIFWGLGFMLLSFSLFFLEGNHSIWHIWVLALITIWGTRLFSLFITRKMRKNIEDPRYAEWRKEWKYFYMRSFFQVYMLQMVLMIIIAIPLFFIFSHAELDPIFTLIWWAIALFWFSYEVIADKQIVQFLKTKKKWENKVFTSGLWKYSRNPNYFWESIFWLWISIISLPISLFWIIWYICITFLLLYVSGVPMKEERQKRKENWEEYAKKTNKFIPWFPKN